MSKPTGKLLFAYQTIADLEVERDTLRTANQRLEGEVARLTAAAKPDAELVELLRDAADYLRGLSLPAQLVKRIDAKMATLK